MKGAMYSVFLAMGIMAAVYIGSYFLTVSPLQVGVGSAVPGLRRYNVFPVYWRAPVWLHAPSLYAPVHLLDEKYIRPSKWKPHSDTETTAYGKSAA
jgi:hypothetical protein